MQMIYSLIGRLLFPRQQDWERRKNAKTFVLTVAFTLCCCLILAEMMRLMYYHKS